MTISAPDITRLQRCPRMVRMAGAVVRIPPRVVFERELTRMAEELARRRSVRTVTDEAAARFLETAVRPGLAASGDVYTLARDFANALRTVGEALGRRQWYAMDGRRLVLDPAVTWECTSRMDSFGILHRWVTVSEMTSDALARELHSWEVVGDCAAAAAGMELHIAELGRIRRGRLHSPWVRIYRHPAVMGRYGFQKSGGEPLGAGWKPLWYSEKNDPKDWVDLMERDGVRMVHDIKIKPPTGEQCEEVRRQILLEAARLATVPADFREIPMYRPACDLPPCVYRTECYTP